MNRPARRFWVSFVGTVHYAGLGAFVASAWLYFRAEEEGAAAAHQCDVEAAQLEQQRRRSIAPPQMRATGTRISDRHTQALMELPLERSVEHRHPTSAARSGDAQRTCSDPDAAPSAA